MALSRKHGDPMVVAFNLAEDGEPQRWIYEIALKFDRDECLNYPFAKSRGYGQVWEQLAFTESDIAAAVEAMRARCEAIARTVYDEDGETGARQIADAVAALKEPGP